ncbi:MAG TPA: hypothetical protein VGU68_01350 [Ktedonobacteraceae bacterium]|nr:hypothetical protein [Ktedonobacteraceae bacterium]
MMANSQRKRSAESTRRVQQRLRLTIFPCMLIILFAGAVALLWQVQHAQPTRADGSNVVGPPTLPARTVDQILAQMGSPMVGTGAVIEAASRQTNIDDAFALGVWWTETNDGAAGVGLADRNPGSVRGNVGYPSAFDGYTIYPSYSAAIVDWFNLLRSRYVDQGLTSVYTICRPYVGTTSAYLWAGKVVNLMLRYHGEAPPPTVVPSPTPRLDAARTLYKQLHVAAPKPQGTTAHITGNAQAPVTRAVVPVATHHALAVQHNTPATAPFIILLGLLAALGIALWGLLIRRSIPAAPASSPVADMQTPSTEALALPALYANEFSPVLAPQPVVSTEQLSWSQQRQPTPVPALAGVAGGGLLTRYAAPGASPRAELQPTSVYVENVWPTATNAGAPLATMPVTSFAEPSVPVTPAPASGAEPARFAGVRRGGLLRRYALEKADQ